MLNKENIKFESEIFSTKDKFEFLITKLSTYSAISNVTFALCDFGKLPFAEVIKTLSKYTKIKFLKILGIKLNEDACKELAELISSSMWLEQLHIENTYPASFALQCVFAAIGKSISLTKLIFSEPNLGIIDYKNLTECLRNTQTLRSLILNSNLDNYGAFYVAAGLSVNRSIIEVNLGTNTLQLRTQLELEAATVINSQPSSSVIAKIEDNDPGINLVGFQQYQRKLSKEKLLNQHNLAKLDKIISVEEILLKGFSENWLTYGLIRKNWRNMQNAFYLDSKGNAYYVLGYFFMLPTEIILNIGEYIKPGDIKLVSSKSTQELYEDYLKKFGSELFFHPKKKDVSHQKCICTLQ